MIRKLLSLLVILTVASGYAQSVFNVRDFGAKGDGKALDSPAINKAIETCAKKGGGTVMLPAGQYLSGSIRMKSNIELRLETGATIIATSDHSAYDPSEFFGGPEYQDGGYLFP